MFTIVSTYGILKSPAAQWMEHDISTMPSNEVFSVFRQLFIVLTPQGMNDDIVVDIEELRSDYSASTQTLQILLNDRTQSITTTMMPSYQAQRCIFIDARKAGYTVNKALPGGATDSAALEIDKIELQISRPNVDMEYFADRCMVSVNGFFHKTQANNKMAFINNGAVSLFSTAKNYVGVLSFERIGSIAYHPISSNNIHPALSLAPLKNGIHVDYDGPSLVGKSVLLVIGGYLHFPDYGVFQQISDNTFSIHPSAIPLVQRYSESKDVLNLAPMQPTPSDVNDTSVDVPQLYSDTSLTYYLTHPNTFFVIVDTPNLSYQRSQLHSLKIPGRMFAYKQPSQLMILGAGKCAEYWSVKDDGIWAVNIDPAYYGTIMFETAPSQGSSLAGVSTQVATFDGFNNYKPYMLDIIADTVIS